MKVRIKLTKLGSIRYVGHLDFMRFFQKALRKSGIACAFSGGFSPHLLISFASPLGVGLESVGEYVDVELAYRDPFEMSRDDLEKLKSMGLSNDELPEAPPSEELLSKINAIMPEGVLALEMTRVEENKGKAMAMVRGADYVVFLEEGYLSRITDPDALSGFLSQDEIVIHKVSKKTENDTDIKPLIYDMRILTPTEAAGKMNRALKNAPGRDARGVQHRTERNETEETDSEASAGTGECMSKNLQPEETAFDDPRVKAADQRILGADICQEISEAGYPRAIFLSVSAGSAANLKPETVLEAFAAFTGQPLDSEAVRILRTEMYGPEGKKLGELGISF